MYFVKISHVQKHYKFLLHDAAVQSVISTFSAYETYCLVSKHMRGGSDSKPDILKSSSAGAGTTRKPMQIGQTKDCLSS